MRAPTRERMISIMARAGLVTILSFSCLGQAAAGARHRMNRKIRPRTCVACDGIAGVGRWNGCLRGYKISAGWLFVTNATLKTFLECST